MPQLEPPSDQFESIVQLFRLLHFCNHIHHFDEITHSSFKDNINENDLPTLESDISTDVKKEIWRSCRHTLQRLLLQLIENEVLSSDQLEILTNVLIQLGEPIYELRRDGEILIQVRRFDRSPTYFQYKINLEDRNIEYNFN